MDLFEAGDDSIVNQADEREAAPTDFRFEFEAFPVPAAPDAGTNRQGLPVATGKPRRGTISGHTDNGRSETLGRQAAPGEPSTNDGYDDGVEFPGRDQLTEDILNPFAGLLGASFPMRSKVPMDWGAMIRPSPGRRWTRLKRICAIGINRTDLQLGIPQRRVETTYPAIGSASGSLGIGRRQDVHSD